MHRTRSTAARLAPLLLVFVLGVVLAACGAQSAFQNVGENLDGGGDAGVPAAGENEEPDAGGPGSEGSGDNEAPPLAAPIEQRIIKTGEVTLEVTNVGETLGLVRAMVVELGGYVGGSQAGTLDERATLTIRIPAASFEDALARLHGMDADLVAEATREQDVTGQVVDLAARIDNLEASEASYRELVARAERVEDILAVQSRLDQVRGEIEQLTAQLEALEGQAALSTLTITLVPRATPVATTTAAWDPSAQLDRALASLVGIGQGLLDGLIWFIVVWLPILLILAVIGLVALRGVLEVRRRMPAATPAATDDGAA
jgi:hypothetical protein